MKRQESLLPGTRALPCGTVAVEHWHGQTLVRYRHFDGITDRQAFADSEDAHAFYQQCAAKLSAEAKARARAEAIPPWKRGGQP